MRFNLWVTINKHSKVVCFGEQSELNDIVLHAGIEGDVHVLPDTHEPVSPIPSRP